MASHLIGISGRKRSGKDSFASRLIEKHGFTRVAFADPLKALALDVNPFFSGFHLVDAVDAVGWEGAKEDDEVRTFLQDLGVGVRQHLGDTTWVDAAMATVDSIPGPVVITDVRFPNEVAAVRTAGGSIVRVNRPGLPQDDLHISETALDAVVPDYLVNNASSLTTLKARATIVAMDVLRKR